MSINQSRHISYDMPQSKINETASKLRSASMKPNNKGPFVALMTTSIFCIGAIMYSHYAQVRDKEEMRDGVRRDKERLKIKRRQKREQ